MRGKFSIFLVVSNVYAGKFDLLRAEAIPRLLDSQASSKPSGEQ